MPFTRSLLPRNGLRIKRRSTNAPHAPPLPTPTLLPSARLITWCVIIFYISGSLSSSIKDADKGDSGAANPEAGKRFRMISPDATAPTKDLVAVEGEVPSDDVVMAEPDQVITVATLEAINAKIDSLTQAIENVAIDAAIAIAKNDNPSEDTVSEVGPAAAMPPPCNEHRRNSHVLVRVVLSLCQYCSNLFERSGGMCPSSNQSSRGSLRRRFRWRLH